MSVGLETTVNDDQVADDKASEIAASASILSGSSESQSQSEEGSTEFDPEFYEETFGLPAGSLKDVTDAQSALDMIRTFTDRTLIAGLGGFAGGADVPQTKAAPATPAVPKAEEKKAETTPTDFEKFKAELMSEFEAKLNAERATAAQAEIARRIAAKIDSWGSAKYGVGQARTYKQAREAKRLAEMVYEHANAAAALGQQVTVESTLERLRLIDDETYTPTKKKAQVGTPGAGGNMGAKGDKMPRNIHEALRSNQAGF
jgi:hypothetical protein